MPDQDPPPAPPPAAPRALVEGRDFYREAGRWVFTELFLRERGYCCESGCRHCPYGFRKRQESGQLRGDAERGS